MGNKLMWIFWVLLYAWENSQDVRHLPLCSLTVWWLPKRKSTYFRSNHSLMSPPTPDAPGKCIHQDLSVTLICRWSNGWRVSQLFHHLLLLLFPLPGQGPLPSGVADSPAPWKQSWKDCWILHLGHTSQVCVSSPLLSFVREMEGKAEFFKETLKNICFQTEVFMPLPQSFPMGLLCPGTELVLHSCLIIPRT